MCAPHTRILVYEQRTAYTSRIYTHTHTHTHIYIYIYAYVFSTFAVFLSYYQLRPISKELLLVKPRLSQLTTKTPLYCVVQRFTAC